MNESSDPVGTVVDEDLCAAALKKQFVRTRGYWSPLWDGVLQLDREYFRSYLKFSSVPWESGTLSPMVKEFIYIAIDAATTHLFEPGIEIHVKNALGYGASPDQVMAVLEATSLIGIQTSVLGASILLEESAAMGRPVFDLYDSLTPRQAEVKEAFVERMGFWSDRWEAVLRMNADYLRSYLDLASKGRVSNELDDKTNELIQIAVHSAATHLEEKAVRRHVRRALEEGASPGEIMEVFELTSVLGVHTLTIGVPVLIRESANHQGKCNGIEPGGGT